ncbi:PLP-dependent aminotransferase family protein [Falsiroseomonas sp. HC035]|uniref:aminotransferase-like domain-containing protein n=1 Tax=Falsiroseomonas sp. HC035 TaxID=3390999 RepID=UPI003D3196FC
MQPSPEPPPASRIPGTSLVFTVERGGAASVADQIATRFATAIRQGEVAPGARLPSIRGLARRLGVSLHSVVEAYDRLAAGGLVVAQPGSGVFAGLPTLRQDVVALPEPDTADPLGLAQAAIDAQGTALSPGNGYLPLEWVRDAWTGPVLARFQRRLAETLPHAAPPQGIEALRDQVASRLAAQGIAIGLDGVLTTFGSSHGLALVIQTWLRPGDTVLVEDPGYFLLFPMLERHGVRILPVPRHPEGPDLDAVEAACRQQRPKLFFVQSVLHNPTGWTATPANLHRLLGIAERHGLLLVEDDAYGDLHPGSPVRLVQLGGGDQVVYVGGYTKTLGPGARVGYLATSRARMAALLETKALSVLTGSSVDELLILEMLAGGQYRRHLDRLRPRLAAARGAVAQHLAALGMEIGDASATGLFIWARLPAAWQAGRLAEEAWRRGVLLARGELFRPGRQPSDRLRFNVARSNDQRLLALLQDSAAAA